MKKTFLKKIVYTDPATSETCLFSPASKEDLERVLGPLTNEEYEDHVWDRAIPEGAIDPVYIEEKDIPDWYFRDAWKQNVKTKKIEIDMDKARQVHMNNIRNVRNERLTELDKRKYGSEYDSQRQALRDITETFKLDKAKTPEELRNLWPEELK